MEDRERGKKGGIEVREGEGGREGEGREGLLWKNSILVCAHAAIYCATLFIETFNTSYSIGQLTIGKSSWNSE